MSRSWCERESDVVQGLRTGQLSSELRSHVLGCSICTETQGVARSMLRVAAVVKEENEPIAAGLVWRRVEKQRKEIALKRAARPLIFMRALSVVCVVLSVAWGVRYLWRSVFFGVFSGRNDLLNRTVGSAAAIAVLAIAIGAGYLLHDSRRSGEDVLSV